MYKRRHQRRIVLGMLLCTLFIMVVGYSAFSSKLDIKGSSMVTSKWDIEITNLLVKQEVGAKNKAHSFDKLNANMEADFYLPGDEITYEVTVSNLGSLDAVLDSIKINMDSQDVIQFKVDGIMSGDVLKQGESTKFDVIMTYNENITTQPDMESVNFEMNLNYLQNGNSSNFAGADSDVSDMLAINGIDLDASETSVKAEVSASNAIKYYYSLDNDKWYESIENIYTIYHLTPYTDYVMHIKAEDVNGNVVFSSKAFQTLDNTKPELKLTLGNNIKGNNEWYKGLDINIEASDLGEIAESKYCVTSNDTCEPNTDLILTEGNGTYQFAPSADNQTLCVLIKDKKGNETKECTEAYKIDSENPTLTKMTLTPNEDTLQIVLETNDEHSGVLKYYYSKDNGKTYIESDSPNYTFMNLDEGDYLITAYIEDASGNISETTAQSTTIRYELFCNTNGINNLSDCVIATEANNNNNIEEAKRIIEAKGTPDFTKTSPAIIYSENHGTNTSTVSYGTYITVANDYTFNSLTGNYTLINHNVIDPETIDLNDGKDYYMTSSQSGQNSTMYKLVGITTTINQETGAKTYNLTKYDYTTSIQSYDNSSAGMYAASDDDGISYYYRGAVSGNYVKLADKYWRIIRVNGDGTLRLIYDGTTPHMNGETSSDRQVASTKFNQKYTDNAYIGYMFGDIGDFEISETTVQLAQGGLNPTAKYYFGSSYIFDVEKQEFKLDGELVSATVTEYREKYNDKKYFTCTNLSSTATCPSLNRVHSANSPTSLMTTRLTAGSTSYEKAHANKTDSTVKTYLENWYQNNLMNVDNIISKDTIFCNNREISTYKTIYYPNTGYGPTATFYNTPRIYGEGMPINPYLNCPQANDRFSVTAVKGNGKLSAPIGLITADEVKLAGASSSQNTLYYLYTGTNYWTMSPSQFSDWTSAMIYFVNSVGTLYNWNEATQTRGVRPVINLDTTKVTFTGTGTMQEPYVVEGV